MSSGFDRASLVASRAFDRNSELMELSGTGRNSDQSAELREPPFRASRLAFRLMWAASSSLPLYAKFDISSSDMQLLLGTVPSASLARALGTCAGFPRSAYSSCSSECSSDTRIVFCQFEQLHALVWLVCNAASLLGGTTSSRWVRGFFLRPLFKYGVFCGVFERMEGSMVTASIAFEAGGSLIW